MTLDDKGTPVTITLELTLPNVTEPGAIGWFVQELKAWQRGCERQHPDVVQWAPLRVRYGPAGDRKGMAEALMPMFATYLSEWSEEVWCATWFIDWEHEVWEMWHDGRVHADRATVMQAWVDLTGMWIHPTHDDGSWGYAVVPVDAWREQHAAWRAEMERNDVAGRPLPGVGSNRGV